MGRVGVKPDGSQPTTSTVTRGGGATTSYNDDLFSVSSPRSTVASGVSTSGKIGLCDK